MCNVELVVLVVNILEFFDGWVMVGLWLLMLELWCILLSVFLKFDNFDLIWFSVEILVFICFFFVFRCFFLGVCLVLSNCEIRLLSVSLELIFNDWIVMIYFYIFLFKSIFMLFLMFCWRFFMCFVNFNILFDGICLIILFDEEFLIVIIDCLVLLLIENVRLWFCICKNDWIFLIVMFRFWLCFFFWKLLVEFELVWIFFVEGVLFFFRFCCLMLILGCICFNDLLVCNLFEFLILVKFWLICDVEIFIINFLIINVKMGLLKVDVCLFYICFIGVCLVSYFSLVVIMLFVDVG